MNKKALSYLGLAKKAGMLEIGEEYTCATIRAGKAKLVFLALDASDNARRRAEGALHGRNAPLIVAPFSKAEISFQTGRPGCSMAAFTDIGFAAAFARSLADSEERFSEIAEQLEATRIKVGKRREEAKVHEKNKKIGKRRKSV